MRVLISTIIVFLTINLCLAQTSQELIRISQTGYYPSGEKIAVVVGGTTSEPFYVITANGQDTTFTGTLSSSSYWNSSGETVRKADFTSMIEWGDFRISVPSVGYSYFFNVGNGVHASFNKALIKGFYFQRASMALTAQYAGQWARAAGHPDDFVYIHESVVSTKFFPNEFMTGGGSPKGWYDAGDYNKYIVNSGITNYTLLSLDEHFPGYYKNYALNIPEKNNQLPDLLDEILWNLEWMLTMQDPSDGGVSHKLTSANFTGTVMPSADVNARYYVFKSTAATLDFAAVMATAARVFKDFETIKPGFAAKCEQAAYDAWNWARKNPNKEYDQWGNINPNFDPDITTGEYGNGNFSDEFDWAAAELYITSKADTFYTMTNLASAYPAASGWQYVAGLPFISLGYNKKDLTALGYSDTVNVKNKIISLADGIMGDYYSSPYRVAVGSGDFYWGHNSVVANKGIMLLQAYYLTKEEKYLDGAASILYYLTGRNATGYCMVTGYGDKSPMNLHHRISKADGIVDPVPGLLVGGPNAQVANGESCSSYPSGFPAKRYLDDYCSFSTNEIAINWNAAIAYLSGAVEAVYNGYIPGEWSGLTPIEKFEKKANAVLLYPNPTSGKTFLKSDSDILDAKVFDMTGVEMFNVPLIFSENTYLSTQELKAGLYFIVIETKEGTITKKLIKQ